MSKESLRVQAYQIIKEKILDCDFLPGTLLNENYLCQLLAISRTPIRDALSRLEHEGLVQITPPKGFLIREITLHDLNAYFETRYFLERHTFSAFGKQVDKHELEIFSGFFNENKDFSDHEDFYRIASSLHNIFIEESFNPYFIQTYEQLNIQERRMRRLLPLSPDCMLSLRDLYRNFLTLTMEKNWTKAAELLELILDTYKNFTFSSFLSSNLIK